MRSVKIGLVLVSMMALLSACSDDDSSNGNDKCSANICNGNTLVLCNQGVPASPIVCPPGTTCDAAQGQCRGGTGMTCDYDGAKCEGSVLKTCSGGNVTHAETCPLGCIDDHCAECAESAKACEGKVVKTCQNGKWQMGETCAQSCADGQCIGGSVPAKCEKNVCQDSSVLLVCDPVSGNTTIVTCPYGCANDRCNSASDTGTHKNCDDPDFVEYCEGDAVWYCEDVGSGRELKSLNCKTNESPSGTCDVALVGDKKMATCVTEKLVCSTPSLDADQGIPFCSNVSESQGVEGLIMCLEYESGNRYYTSLPMNKCEGTCGSDSSCDGSETLPPAEDVVVDGACSTEGDYACCGADICICGSSGKWETDEVCVESYGEGAYCAGYAMGDDDPNYYIGCFVSDTNCDQTAEMALLIGTCVAVENDLLFPSYLCVKNDRNKYGVTMYAAASGMCSDTTSMAYTCNSEGVSPNEVACGNCNESADPVTGLVSVTCSK